MLARLFGIFMDSISLQVFWTAFLFFFHVLKSTIASPLKSKTNEFLFNYNTYLRFPVHHLHVVVPLSLSPSFCEENHGYLPFPDIFLLFYFLRTSTETEHPALWFRKPSRWLTLQQKWITSNWEITSIPPKDESSNFPWAELGKAAFHARGKFSYRCGRWGVIARGLPTGVPHR